MSVRDVEADIGTAALPSAVDHSQHQKPATVFAPRLRVDVELFQLAILTAKADREVEGDAGDAKNTEFCVFRDIDGTAFAFDQRIESVALAVQDRSAVECADEVVADLTIFRLSVANGDAHPPATPWVFT